MKLVTLIKMCLNETYSRVHVKKILSDAFSVQKGVKHRDPLSPLFFNYALEYAIKKVKENHEGMQLNVTYQILVYAEGVNIWSENINTTKTNMDALLQARRQVGLYVNTEKTKYMIVSHHQNTG